jgi:hypothetical protein
VSILDTIAALNLELDAHPDAHDTRGLLADALEDAGGEFHDFEWAVLPADWFKILAPAATYWSADVATRREAEDAAALAFSKLPAERQAALLAVPVGGAA